MSLLDFVSSDDPAIQRATLRIQARLLAGADKVREPLESVLVVVADFVQNS
jgi:hypothetical protein